ncbi:MAG: AAA family ATPase [Pseudomonadota bacterium]|nr:AAA family ATPase [Pseudomonadota bacterium]MDP1905498.1 AAA family ATPase [Pseudomonadota bacterium]
MILLVGGEKGGTGKTTIATNLAALRASEGKDVLLVDTDPQGSASLWVQVRDEKGHAPRVANVQKFGRGLASELLDLKGRYQDIIIDAGGRDSPELRASLVRADMAVIPVQASQFDLWTLDRMEEMVKLAAEYNPGLVVKILVTRASTNQFVAEARKAAELIDEFEAFSLAATVIKDRIAYRRAAAEGKGVTEITKSEYDKAAREIRALYKEIFA